MTSISRFNTVGLNNIKPAAPAQEMLKTDSEETIRGNVPVNGNNFEITTSSVVIRYERDENSETGWRRTEQRTINDGDKHGVHTYRYDPDAEGGGYYSYKNNETGEYWTSTIREAPRK